MYFAAMEKRVREALTGEDRKAWREIEAFEARGTSRTGAMVKLATAPFQAMLPDSLTRRMHAALETLVEIVQKGDEWGVSPEQVLAGSPYASLAGIHERGRMEEIRSLLESQTGQAVLRATLQGAGLGFGGVLLAAADVPLLLVSHLKLLTRMGICCGYDLRRPGERDFVLGLLKLSYCLSDWEEKRASLEELWRMIQRRAARYDSEGEIARAVLFKSIGAFADKIGPILLRREAGTLVPLLGSAFGAGCNYLLTQDVVSAGRATLLKRFLTERALRQPARA